MIKTYPDEFFPVSRVFCDAGGSREAIATIFKISRVHCGLQPFLMCELYLEMLTLSLNLNVVFAFSRSGFLHRMDKISESATFFRIKSVNRFSQKFKVVTNSGSL